MIFVSFSFAEDALSNDVKNYEMFTLAHTVYNENQWFRFLGDTRYTHPSHEQSHCKFAHFPLFQSLS